MTGPVSALARVYWLSWLAHHFQGEVFEDTSSRDARKGSSSSRIGKTLTHLSTCLTRGRQSEASRIAVTSSIHDVNGISVQVFGSPPESTPHASSSSSSTSGAGAVEEDAGSINNVALARNSDNTQPARIYKTVDIGPELDAAAVAQIQAIKNRPYPMPAELVPPLEDFFDYVVYSLAILRAAADLLRASSDLERQAVCRAVWIFFLHSCYQKLKSRVSAFKRLFPAETLRTWTMGNQDDKFAAVDIDVEDILVQAVLEKAGLLPIKSRYTADVTTVALWWKALMALLTRLQQQISDDAPAPDVVLTSHTLHSLLQKLPPQLWQMASLNHLLQHCRHTVNNPTTTQSSSGNQDAAEEELEVGEEMSSLNNPISARPPTPKALPYCSIFYRAVDALTAWTTGPTYLLHSRVATTPNIISLAVVDLPRATIPSTSAEELLSCWETERWTPSQLNKIRSQLTDGDPSTPPTDGECHAEAGLIASAIAHIRQRVQQGSRGADPAEEPALSRGTTGSYGSEQSINALEPDELAKASGLMFQAGDGSGGSVGEDPLSEPEPEDLANIFGSMFSEGSSELELAIGVARKCCPLCRILADVAEQQYEVKLDLPGQHARFHPWVPPCWLPESVLLEIERRLLPILDKLAHSPSPASRASSPGSDDGQDVIYTFREGDSEMARAIKLFEG